MEYSNRKEKFIRFFCTILLLSIIYILWFSVVEKWLYQYSGFRQITNQNLIFTLAPKRGVFFLFLSACFITPVLEEILFRAPVIFSPKNISLFIGGVSYIIITKTLHINSWKILFLIGAISGVFIYKIWSTFLIKKEIKILTTKKMIVVFTIITSLIFGAVHTLNYSEVNIYSLILTIPIVFSGFGFAYIRIKNGLIWSIVLHSMHNLPLAIVLSIDKL